MLNGTNDIVTHKSRTS